MKTSEVWFTPMINHWPYGHTISDSCRWLQHEPVNPLGQMVTWTYIHCIPGGLIYPLLKKIQPAAPGALHRIFEHVDASAGWDISAFTMIAMIVGTLTRNLLTLEVQSSKKWLSQCHGSTFRWKMPELEDVAKLALRCALPSVSCILHHTCNLFRRHWLSA